MRLSAETSVAESIGRRILERRGSEAIELIYFLEERNSLELLREFVALREGDQAKIVAFLKKMNRRDDLTLRVIRDGMRLQPGG